MEYEPESFWDQSGTSESMTNDLRLAHMFMDLSERTTDGVTARECYDKARTAHDTVDRLLRRKLPRSSVAREDLGAAVARLRQRLARYESTQP